MEQIKTICFYLDHKTSLKVQFLEIEIYTSSESWINTLWIGLDNIWQIQLFENLESEGAKNKKRNIEKIAFKVVQMKFLAIHITNQKLSFDIFTVRNLQNIFMEHDLYLIS